MIDANFKSTVYLKNGVETSPITVTPVLYLSNGAKYVLPDVKLERAGTATIDINEGLKEQGISPWATLTGYMEIQYTWPWDPICGTIRNLDTVHSLIFNYGLRSSKPFQPPNQPPPPPDQTTNVVEGMWWKQEANVTGFVALANTTSHGLTVEVQVSDNQNVGFGTRTVTISPHGMKTVTLDELASAKSSDGGIQVAYIGKENDLLVNGGLEDESSGYSAVLPFTPAVAPAAQAATTSIAELGLMSGAADPMMQFPAGTTFTPYTVLRNISDSPVSATPTMWWMAAGAAQSASLPAMNLSPHSSRSLDVPSLISSAGLRNFNGSINLVFDVQGIPGGLLMAGGSVDQNNTYVFEVTPHGIAESASKSLSYWSTGNGDDTMVTLWNPADEAQDLVFQVSFSDGQYGFLIHLEPRAARVFNISEIIQNQIPDPEGNTIPASVHEGGAKIAGSHADNENILVVMDAGTYNVHKATCGLYCQGCDGVTGYSMVDDPFNIPFGGQKQQTVYQTWNTGAQYDDTQTSTWTTSDSNIATVRTGLVSDLPPKSVHGMIRQVS